MTVTGPTFIALQVRDVARAAEFYETRLGLRRTPPSPRPVPWCSTPPRRPSPSGSRCPGWTWTRPAPTPGSVSRCGCTPTTAQGLHDRLAAEGVPITVAPFDSPFGRTFTFTDPDGYAITIHDQP